MTYAKNCEDLQFSPKEFLPSAYQMSLREALIEFSGEDAEQHGRLKEIREMLLDFDTDRDLISETDNEMFYINDIDVYREDNPDDENMDNILEFMMAYSAFSDWKRLFTEVNVEKVHKRILPKIRDSILNKKGIFPSPKCYQELEKHFNGVISSLSKQDCPIKDMNVRMDKIKQILNENENSLGGATPRMADKVPTTAGGKNRNKKFDEDIERLRIRDQDYFLDYVITDNSKLVEYYIMFKKSLKYYFNNSKFSNSILLFDNDNENKSNLDMIKKFPSTYKCTNELIQLIFGPKKKDYNPTIVTKEIEKASKFASEFYDLAYYINKGLIMAKRDIIMETSDISRKYQALITPAFRQKLLDDNLMSTSQIMAVIDVKIIELLIIKLINSRELAFVDENESVSHPLEYILMLIGI